MCQAIAVKFCVRETPQITGAIVLKIPLGQVKTTQSSLTSLQHRRLKLFIIVSRDSTEKGIFNLAKVPRTLAVGLTIQPPRH